ncbi:MAG: hypothetical protein MJ238_04390 [Bacilli bacterium]|nr:hypothetical protein [Bacilli bacterium]
MNRYPEIISNTRWLEICKMVKEKGMYTSYKDYTASEIKKIIIPETLLSEEEIAWAIDKYIKRLSNVEFEERFNLSESAVKARHKKLSLKLRTTCTRLFIDD